MPLPNVTARQNQQTCKALRAMRAKLVRAINHLRSSGRVYENDPPLHHLIRAADELERAERAWSAADSQHGWACDPLANKDPRRA